jgi:hypothetical protein
MANKSVSVVVFVLTLIVLGPLMVASAVFALGWWWEGFSGCIFASPYSTCGYGQFTKATIFSVIAFGCFAGIQKMWNKTK